MESFLLKSAEIVAPAQTKPCVLNAIRAESNCPQGTVFGVVRILGKKTSHKERFSELVEETLERFSQNLTEGMNAPRRFEQILQSLNEEIATRKESASRIPLTDVQAVVGLVWNNQLFLSGIGNLSALFLHKKTKKRYTVYDLDTQFTDQEQTWDKPFVTVLDGEIQAGDVLYVATRVSAREVSAAALQDILITLPPRGALKRISQHLGVDTNFAAICFQARIEKSTGGQKKSNPISSLGNIGETRTETETLLADQKPDLRKLLHSFSSPLLKKLSAPGTSGPKSIILRLLRSVLQILIAIMAALALGIRTSIKFLLKGTGILLKTTKDKEKREDIQEKIRSFFIDIKDGIASTSLLVRIASVVVLVGVGTGVFITSSIRAQKVRTEEQQAFDTITAHVEEKITAAEASLIYDNVDQARALLTEAATLLESIPQTDKQYESAREEYEQMILVIGRTLQKITDITPILLAERTDAEQGSFRGFLEANGTFYAFTDTAIYSYSTLQQSLEQTDATFGSILGPTTITSDEDEWLFLDVDGSLGRFNPEAGTINPILSGIEKLSSVEDIFLYNENVYALTASGNQIVKMRPQGENYEAGTPWVTSLTSGLEDARALAIDGEVYVLTTSSILKFTSGREADWSEEQVDPAIQNPIDLWTKFENEYLYVFEPSQSRVIVFKKDGTFLTQYVAEELQDARGMHINEAERVLYFVTASALHKFDLSHF